MSSLPPPRYQIPTHLNVPDKLDIPLLGITISLTMRQGALFLFGWSAAFAWWHATTSWQTMGVLPMVLHWGLPGALALLVFLIAMLQWQGRSCEQWVLIGLRYLISEKIFVWHSVAGEHLQIEESRSTRETGQERRSTDLFSPLGHEEEEATAMEVEPS